MTAASNTARVVRTRVRPDLRIVAQAAVPAQQPSPAPTPLPIDVECARFDLTDIGNADRFRVRHGNHTRWSPARGWLIWDGRRWCVDDCHQVLSLAKETARLILAEAADAEDQDRRDALAGWAKASGSAGRVSAMLQLARPDVRVPDEGLDHDTWLLNVLNGTIDLRTGELRPHNRADLITKLAPVEYHPEAQCPRWHRFLQEVFQSDEELIGYVQRAVGYSLTGLAREQCLFFLFGGGSNGKGVFLVTLRFVLGDYAQRTKPDVFLEQARSDSKAATPDLARMVGVRMIITSEVKDGAAMAEGLIKELTGEERLTARMLYGQPIEFDPVAKIWFAANHKPIVQGTDHAIWRRIKMIPFEATFTAPGDPNHREGNPPKDPNLRHSLRDEAPGILAWAVRGCLEWQRTGMQEPDVVQAAVAEYRSEQDVLGQFIDACCVVEPAATVTPADLRRAYTSWCEERGDIPLGGRRFRAGMIARGFQQDEGRTNRATWRGLRLVNPPRRLFPGIPA